MTHFRLALQSTLMILLLLCAAIPVNAACYIKKARVSLPTCKGSINDNQQVHIAHRSNRLFPFLTKRAHPQFSDTEPVDDSYKGILALAFGSASIVMVLLALISPSIVGIIIPAFFVGVAGIVFGALKKNNKKQMGRIGMILSIISVAAISLFVIAVFVALASFT